MNTTINTNNVKVSAISDAIKEMDDSSAVSLWNEYCEQVRRDDDRIENMDNLPELFSDLSGQELFNLLNRFYFGHDAMNGEASSANPNRDWFTFNGYGNIVSSDCPSDFIDVDELAEWIVENNDALYNDDIQDILDEMEEGKEEG